MENILEKISGIAVGTEITQEQKNLIESLVSIVESSYTVVCWPESQDLMDEEWFDDEAVLLLGAEDAFGPSAYVVPTAKLI